MKDIQGKSSSDLLERNADLDVIDLAALGARHLSSLGRLPVSPRQEILGGSFAETLHAWRSGPANHVLGYGFLLEGAPVGAVLFKRPPAAPRWAPNDAATMHGLKITSPLQGARVGTPRVPPVGRPAQAGMARRAVPDACRGHGEHRRAVRLSASRHGQHRTALRGAERTRVSHEDASRR